MQAMASRLKNVAGRCVHDLSHVPFLPSAAQHADGRWRSTGMSIAHPMQRIRQRRPRTDRGHA
jgi:hypothetical protein